VSSFFATLRFFIHLILVAILGYEVTDMGLTLYRTRPLQILPTTPVAKGQTQIISSPLTLNITSLLTVPLFGQPSQEVVSVPVVTPPESPLELKLQGIYYSPRLSYAIIVNGQGKATLYRQGDLLEPDILVQEIHQKEVVLLRNQRKEIVPLATSTANTGQTLPTSSNSSLESNPGELAQSSTPDQLSPEQLLGHYQQQLQSDPTALTRLIRINPVSEGDRFIGYRLWPGPDTTLMTRFGLQSGDIVTAINDVNFDSPIKALGLLQQLTTTDQISIQLLRDGKSESLSFNIRK
jgi:general secretion pathway protein C